MSIDAFIKAIHEYVASSHTVNCLLQSGSLQLYQVVKSAHTTVPLRESKKAYKKFYMINKPMKTIVAPFCIIGVQDLGEFMYLDYARSIKRGSYFNASQTYLHSIDKPMYTMVEISNARARDGASRSNYLLIK